MHFLCTRATFYTVFVSIFNDSNALKIMYCAFDVVHLLLSVTVFYFAKKIKENFKLTQMLCVIFEITILSFFMIEGVYTSKAQNTLYLPIAILLVLLLFIHKVQYSLLISFLYTFVFTFLSYLYKTPVAFKNDLYIAVATFISANIGYVIIANMRHNGAEAIRNYERLSNTDALTGILNKSALDSLCKKLILETEKDFIFIIIDLDDFKSVNDIYGHNVGDEVLCKVGKALKTSFSQNDHIGRFGGDEFIIIIDDYYNLDDTIKKTELAMKKIIDLQFSEPKLKVNCSAGIAVKNKNDNEQTIFQRADRALYDAKESGKGKIIISN